MMGKDRILYPFLWIAASIMLIISATPAYSQSKLRVVETRKIYDNHSYCAFTSLVKFQDKYYCTFREASRHHIQFNDPATWGRIVLLESTDAKEWNKVAEFSQDSTDMRDPKVKVTPDGKRLMLLYHKHRIYSNKQTGGHSVVRLFDGSGFSAEEQRIKVKGYENERLILWNVTIYKKKIQGFVSGTKFMYVTSKDGVNFEALSDLTDWARDNQGMNESNVAFIGRKAYAVVRSTVDQGYLGESRYPFKKWKWKKMNISLGGPNLYKLNNSTLLLGSRDYGRDNNRGKTAIYELTKNHWNEAEKNVILESTNDSSYPCFIEIDKKHLLVSYYSGEATHSNIYISELVIE